MQWIFESFIVASPNCRIHINKEDLIGDSNGMLSCLRKSLYQGDIVSIILMLSIRNIPFVWDCFVDLKIFYKFSR